MLSRDLHSLQIWLDASRRGGPLTMTKAGADAFSRVLVACFEQACALEESALVNPAPQRRLAKPLHQMTTDELIDHSRLIANATNVVMLHAAAGFGGTLDLPTGGDAV